MSSLAKQADELPEKDLCLQDFTQQSSLQLKSYVNQQQHWTKSLQSKISETEIALCKSKISETILRYKLKIDTVRYETEISGLRKNLTNIS